MQLREQVGQFEKLKAEAMKDNPKMKVSGRRVMISSWRA